jgi:molybdopterin molybdotransferase
MSDESAGQRADRYRETRPWQDLDTMLSVDEARDRILASISVSKAEPVALEQCHGLILAQDVVANSPVPPFRNSAMDGFAVRATDVQSATSSKPVFLNVVGNLPAGREPDLHVGSGQAVRIMTGAAMPEGADTVVRFEETNDPPPLDDGRSHRDSSVVQILRSPKPGDNVREAGEDIAVGDKVLEAGTLINPAIQGALAAVNLPTVHVIPRPRVGILATGDEVVDPGESIQPGQIRNSNNFMLAGMVQEAGGEPHILGIARDTASDIRESLAEATKYDLIVTSGGVSLGDYDVVKDVLQAEGSIDLWQVRIKPGKPMAFGHVGDVPLIGLPGNPVASYVAFLQFAVPAIRKMRGLKDAPVPVRRGRLLREHENRGNRRHFVRGTCFEQAGELVVEPVEVQGSGVLTSVIKANCMFVIPEELNHAPADSYVDIIPLHRYD